MTPLSPLFYVECAACGAEEPAVRREGRIEPPDGWAILTPECCGAKRDLFACETHGCPTKTVERMFDGHPETTRLFVIILGKPRDDGTPSRFFYVREGKRVRLVPA